MRKIEEQMLNAIRERKNWTSGNTGVFFENPGNPYGPRSEIYLHGNHIADFWHNHSEVEVDVRTLKQWPTMTTKSRLRALGVDLVQKQGRLFINNQEV